MRIEVLAVMMRLLRLIARYVGFRELYLVRWLVRRPSRREEMSWMKDVDRRGQVWDLNRLSQRVRLPAKPSPFELRLSATTLFLEVSLRYAVGVEMAD